MGGGRTEGEEVISRKGEEDRGKEKEGEEKGDRHKKLVARGGRCGGEGREGWVGRLTERE